MTAELPEDVLTYLRLMCGATLDSTAGPTAHDLLAKYAAKWRPGDVVRRADGEIAAYFRSFGGVRPQWINVRTGLVCNQLVGDSATLLIRDGQVQS